MILITGAAGFIGYHLTLQLLQAGHDVLGIDNLNDYYDVDLKRDRLKFLEKNINFKFRKIDISNTNDIQDLFQNYKITRVVNLAAQAGVRYSLTNPHVYAASNLVGFLNLIEASKEAHVEHFVYASSSSVYGANTVYPLSETQHVNHPLSLYAATKRSNELMAHSYSHIFNLPTTGLRFFTVYGPWGRPDMALFIFTKKILAGEPIDVFNHGKMKRDFTYIDDIVDGIVKVLNLIPEPSQLWDNKVSGPDSSSAPFRLYNIGNNRPVDLHDYISTIEKYLGKKAIYNYLPMQSGDVKETFADIAKLKSNTNYEPKVNIDQGIKNFLDWYLSYYL